MKPSDQIISTILQAFPYEPTQGQTSCIQLFADFMQEEDPKKAFLLRGYAGTGKTSLVGAWVRALPKIGFKTVLIAPTGRAAKVLSSYSGKKAFTIHKKIYMVASDKNGYLSLKKMENKYTQTLFLIDEASMIGEYSSSESSSIYGNRSLLDDLLSFIYEGKDCFAIFIGDTAQLPPVGNDYSPALDKAYLGKNFGLECYEYELTEVVRQALESGVVKNATHLRKQIAAAKTPKFPLFNLKKQNELIRMNGDDFADMLAQEYANKGIENVAVVCRSNKRTHLFNQQIRSRILYLEEDINVGDYIMVVKNNYHWLDKLSEIGFIANGDIARIQKIRKRESFYGFQFASVFLLFVDYPDHPEVECMILLDTLTMETPALDYENAKKLFEEVMKDYENLPTKKERYKKVKENPYFNALQVKFSYALTCHKTQGGQWERVFVDAGWFTDDMLNTEYLRWMYTALTRATEKTYLVNFKDEFFAD